MPIFSNENSIHAIRAFADAFINSEFNLHIKDDFDLKFKANLFLRKERIKLKLVEDITLELLTNNQAKLKYSFE